ncbi:MAG: hypothetical protein COB93_07530 [Sneathiella sp.]|nr:MAG: hypothetical protein COB93_07530 [Sneathiella sp.]
MNIRSISWVIVAAITFGLGSAAAKADEKESYSAAIDHFVFDFAIPTYANFQASTEKLDQLVESLCATSTPAALNSVKVAFRNTVLSWSVAEVIRFGPVREKNRIERIFFWPDTRSRVQKSVNAQLGATHENLIAPTTLLSGRTVAIQGLPALEVLLFRGDSDRLAMEGGDATRCAFAKAISNNLVNISREIFVAWHSPDAFQETIRTAGPDNPRFRSDAEVIQEILKSGAEMTELISAVKLRPALGDTAKKSKPKRAAFWRSGLTLENIQANISGLVALQEKSRLSDLLPEAERGYARNLLFDARQVENTLTKLIDEKKPWKEQVTETNSRTLLLYLLNPLGGVKDILSIYYPEILGLQLGFNSLDGD